ncbi:MAG: LPS export ABC transporter periplasmic protein LptC, partial [Pseudomonadota bacterium]
MFNLRNFILLSLAVLTIVILSRESETTDEPSVRVDAQLQENSDYYITGMRNTQFDDVGKPAYRLEAARVTHYVETDTAKMEKPHFFYFADGELPWELTANTGT